MGWLTSLLAGGAVLLAAGGVPAHRPVRRERDRRLPATDRGMVEVPTRHSRREAGRAVPDTIELLVIVVRAGLTTRQAIEELAETAPSATRVAFVEAQARLDRGEPPADALEALPERLGRTARPIVDLIGPADRHGLPLAPALEQLAAEARQTRQRRAEAAARRLPVRLSFPLVVCTLPSFVLLAIAPAVLAALSSLGGTAW